MTDTEAAALLAEPGAVEPGTNHLARGSSRTRPTPWMQRIV